MGAKCVLVLTSARMRRPVPHALIAAPQDSSIFVFDHLATVTVDDCTNCRIFLGPIKGSLFVRNCRDCQFIVACQQFRSRDCVNVDVLLCCKTLPIIEASSPIRFGCFRGAYFALAGQFAAAGLSAYNNNWGRIHDFSRASEPHFHLLAEDPPWLAGFFAALPAECAAVEVSLDAAAALVPVTTGTTAGADAASCLVVLVAPPPGQLKKFTQSLALRQARQTKEATLTLADAQRLLPGVDVAAFADAFPAVVVAVELEGEVPTALPAKSLVVTDAARAAQVMTAGTHSLASQGIAYNPCPRPALDRPGALYAGRGGSQHVVTAN